MRTQFAIKTNSNSNRNVSTVLRVACCVIFQAYINALNVRPTTLYALTLKTVWLVQGRATFKKTLASRVWHFANRVLMQTPAIPVKCFIPSPLIDNAKFRCLQFVR